MIFKRSFKWLRIALHVIWGRSSSPAVACSQERYLLNIYSLFNGITCILKKQKFANNKIFFRDLASFYRFTSRRIWPHYTRGAGATWATPPPAYPHGAGAVPGNLWPIFVRSMFSAKNSNLYYLIIIIAMITQMSRVLNSLLSIVRRQTDANLIILPWVLCLVPRVTTCRFYIDTAPLFNSFM